MKQIVQSLNSGDVEVIDVPPPKLKQGTVLVRTKHSVISSGTEKMLLDFGKSSYLEKAMSQPDKVREVITKVRTDGIVPTYDAVRSKLSLPISLGYSNSGVVIESDTPDFKVGDMIASNGPHAEIVRVPRNLCAKVPVGVDSQDSAFCTIASIALQGIRLASPTIGEVFVVTGLGLLGQIAVQLLRANGCRVIGIDYSSERLEAAASFGADVVDLNRNQSPIDVANSITNGNGVDGCIITASTKKSTPISQAAKMCRKRGRIVMVGVTGMNLSRADFYEKEISFQVSCSYGPGRYDHLYEDSGVDYPFGFVRWTENRNMEAVLDLMSSGQLDIQGLATTKVPFSEAERAYGLLSREDRNIGIILTYPDLEGSAKNIKGKVSLVANTSSNEKAVGSGDVKVGILGAGNYVSSFLAPGFKKSGAVLKTIVSSRGLNASLLGRKFGFLSAGSDYSDILSDDDINAVAIATPHNLHASQVIAGLKADKSIYVEKPLALTVDELDEIERVYLESKGILMVGFNRRFSRLIVQAKELLGNLSKPISIVYTVNAGHINNSHWIQDPRIGGGRLIGEACHFIDLVQHLSGSKICKVSCDALRESSGSKIPDTFVITLSMENGSLGTVNYFANGHKAHHKEDIKIFDSGKIISIENFRKLKTHGYGRFADSRLFYQDKGQFESVNKFVETVKNGGCRSSVFDEALNSSKFAVIASNMIAHSS